MSDKDAVVIAGKIVDGMIADEIIANQALIIANLNRQIETYKELDEVKKGIIKDQKDLIAFLENGGIMPMKLWKKLLLWAIGIFFIVLMYN